MYRGAHRFFSLVMRAPGDLVWCSHCTLCDPLNMTIKKTNNSNYSVTALYLVHFFNNKCSVIILYSKIKTLLKKQC